MDILIIIYLAFRIFNKAKQYDFNPWSWVFKLVTLFISTELVVALIVMNFFGMEKILYAVIPALSLALISAFFVFKELNLKISQTKEEIEELEEEDKPNLDYFR